MLFCFLSCERFSPSWKLLDRSGLQFLHGSGTFSPIFVRYDLSRELSKQTDHTKITLAQFFPNPEIPACGDYHTTFFRNIEYVAFRIHLYDSAAFRIYDILNLTEFSRTTKLYHNVFNRFWNKNLPRIKKSYKSE